MIKLYASPPMCSRYFSKFLQIVCGHKARQNSPAPPYPIKEIVRNSSLYFHVPYDIVNYNNCINMVNTD